MEMKYIFESQLRTSKAASFWIVASVYLLSLKRSIFGSRSAELLTTDNVPEKDQDQDIVTTTTTSAWSSFLIADCNTQQQGDIFITVQKNVTVMTDSNLGRYEELSASILQLFKSESGVSACSCESVGFRIVISRVVSFVDSQCSCSMLCVARAGKDGGTESGPACLALPAHTPLPTPSQPASSPPSPSPHSASQPAG